MHFLNLFFAPWDLLLLFCFCFFPFFILFLNCLLFLLLSLQLHCTPVRHYLDSQPLKKGKHAATLGFKSVTENVEVFLRKACVIFQLGCAVAASSWEEGQFHSFTSILLTFVALERTRKGGWGIISQTQKPYTGLGKVRAGMSVEASSGPGVANWKHGCFWKKVRNMCHCC